jgi:hypothetical protein
MKLFALVSLGVLTATASLSAQTTDSPQVAGSRLPPGMFSTLGNQIVEQNQKSVRLACVYWAGMNGEDGVLYNLNGPAGCSKHSLHSNHLIYFNLKRRAR